VGNQSEDRNKVSLKNYKNKSKLQTKEIKSIKKRLAELECSRDTWKKKYKTVKQQSQRSLTSVNLGICPAKHRYPVAIIWLCIQFQMYGGVSFRACRHCIAELCLILSLNCGVPSHVSIRNWACKCGYFRLQQHLADSKVPSTYAVIVDESISIGAERLLLVLGLPLENWSFQKPVSLSDVQVLSLRVGQQWKAEQVSDVLSEVEKSYKIAYIVSDRGNNLVKSYEQNAYIHLPDITHVIANALEKMYKNALFIEMNQICGGLRRRWYMSKSAPLMPPSQRKKARFHNIFTLAVWAKQIKQIYETLDKEQQKELEWFIKNTAIIDEMLCLRAMVSQLSDCLKTEGFNQTTQLKVLQILTDCQTPKTLYFKQQIEGYLIDLCQKQQKNQLPKTLFCCSDIIETAFGKFKYKISTNSIGGITEFALTIANFGTTFSRDEIIKSMESIKIQHLKDWKTENNVTSLAIKRQDIFNKNQNVKK
jgi:hypothetical protein